MPSHFSNNTIVYNDEINWGNLGPTPDMRNTTLLKFFNFQHRKSIIDEETMIISSSKIFRDRYFQMEVQNHHINDPEEGRQYVAQNGTYENQYHFQRANVIGKWAKPFHLISFATGSLQAASKVFCSPDVGLSEPYDACIEIPNFGEYLEILTNRALVLHPDTREVIGSLSDLFLECHNSFVRYEELIQTQEGNILDMQVPAANPYCKDSSLSEQKEFRIVFRPKRSIQQIPVLVRLPNLSKIVDFHDLRDRAAELKHQWEEGQG